MQGKDQSPKPRPEASLPAPAQPELPVHADVAEQARVTERLDRLPPYRIILHNDDKNDRVFVVETICDLTPLSAQKAAAVMMEAHRTGVAQMLTTHRERAELYVEQFQSRELTVTMEPVG